MKHHPFGLGGFFALVVPIVLIFSTARGGTLHCKPGPPPPNCEIVDTVKNNRCSKTGEAWVCKKALLRSRSVDSQSQDTSQSSGKDKDTLSQPVSQQPQEASPNPGEDQ